LKTGAGITVTLVAGAIASATRPQTISVAISTIQRTIPISQQQFSYLSTAFLLAYAAMYAGGGRLLDLIGTRRGFLLIMLWWSAPCALHG
jgi:ACS family hexuronate transporter-like MFS transporter